MRAYTSEHQEVVPGVEGVPPARLKEANYATRVPVTLLPGKRPAFAVPVISSP